MLENSLSGVICKATGSAGGHLLFFNKNLLKNDKNLLTNERRCDKIQTTKQMNTSGKGGIMKKQNYSVMITSILVKAVFVLIIVCCIFAPFIVRVYDNGIIALTGSSVYLPMIITLYLAAAVALVIVVALDRLLSNIRHDKVFVPCNVKILRLISYCCFAVSVIFIYFSILRPFAWLVVIAAAFFGLILRVIKNVFEQAIEIKEENDFTI